MGFKVYMSDAQYGILHLAFDALAPEFIAKSADMSLPVQDKQPV